MKVYKTQQEVEKDIKNQVLSIEGDVKFECSINIKASIIINAGDIHARDINAWNINAWDIHAGNINAWNINARDINAGNFNAGNINAWNINAWDINAGNINAGDIHAWDIHAGDINAGNINAGDIHAWNINTWDILYSAFCCVYKSIKCFSIKARREIHKEPICLEGKIEYKQKEPPNCVRQYVTIPLGGQTYISTSLKKVKVRLAEGQIVEGEIIE